MHIKKEKRSGERRTGVRKEGRVSQKRSAFRSPSLCEDLCNHLGLKIDAMIFKHMSDI